jgi:lipopolysaccharide biosynthesis regulator YciM
MLLAAIEGAISTQYLQGAELANLHRIAAKLRATSNSLDAASAHVEKAIALDPNNSEQQLILSSVRERQKRPAEAYAALEKAVALDKAAGRTTDPAVQRQMYALAVNNRLPQARSLALAQVRTNASPSTWRAAIKLAEQQGNFAAADKVDLFRLQRATNSLEGEGDYYPYVDALMTRGLPGEAKVVLEEAFAAGKLDKNKSPWNDLYKSAVARDAADKSAPNGDVYLGRGDYAKAAAAYRTMAAKGGAGAELANLRLGIALARSGDKAGATTALNAVQGSRAGIAQLWLAYLQSA